VAIQFDAKIVLADQAVPGLKLTQPFAPWLHICRCSRSYGLF
jgi:hypothetical protein